MISVSIFISISAFIISTANANNSSSGNDKFQNLFGSPYSFDYVISSNDFYDSPASVVFVDLDVEDEVIAKYNLAGKTVFCQVNAGAWEFWREDANIFPPEILGNDYEGWPGEKWLDIRETDVILPIMRERFRAAALKGCRGIDANNIFGWEIETGFDIRYQHQIEYNEYIAAEIRVLGMMAGLNNDHLQAIDLVDAFDFGVSLECVAENKCSYFNRFITNGKPVFAVEYTETYDVDGFKSQVCPLVATTGFSFILKHSEQDADFTVSCL